MRLLGDIPAELRNALVDAGLGESCTLEDYPRMTVEEVYKRRSLTSTLRVRLLLVVLQQRLFLFMVRVLLCFPHLVPLVSLCLYLSQRSCPLVCC